MSLVAASSACFELQSDCLSDCYENQASTSSSRPICEGLSSSMQDLSDFCHCVRIARPSSSELQDTAQDERGIDSRFSTTLDESITDAASNLLSCRIPEPQSNDLESGDEDISPRIILSQLCHGSTPQNSNDKLSSEPIKSHSANYSRITAANIVAYDIAGDTENCKIESRIPSSTLTHDPEDSSDSLESVLNDPHNVETERVLVRNVSQALLEQGEKTALTNSEISEKSQVCPQSHTHLLDHNLKSKVIAELQVDSQIDDLIQSPNISQSESFQHNPALCTEHNDENQYLTYWHSVKQCDCELKLAADIKLLQPPPHINVTKQSILNDFKGKRLYLFLDYDGTLTPIVSNPWEAILSSSVRQLLYELAANSNGLITVGIVTGRALTSVKNFVQIVASEHLNFIYAASHGFHIEAAGKMLHHRVGSKYIPILKKAAADLEKQVKDLEGVMLEDNEFAISVHYRNAVVDNAEIIVESIISNVLKHYPELKMTRGKKVFELRINVTWNKGRAVFWLLNAMRVDPFDSNTRVVYVGDDLTDEDAFRAVRALKNSLTILVSDTPNSWPTAATCYVNDPDEVADLLKSFLDIANDSSNL